jgi:hypothetical protein
MSYYSAPFTFNFDTSSIDADAGAVDIDCVALYTACKLAQASEEGILYDRIAEGSGLKNLNPGVQVGITVDLLGTWQLRFPAGNYVARVAGGNLIGGPGGDPIAYTAGVQTLLIQSAASTVVTAGGSVPSAAQNASAVWATILDGSYTANELIRLISAAVAGKLAGAPTGPIEIKSVDGATIRITATVDANGNRTGVTYNVS